jgi:hypothetical protein
MEDELHLIGPADIEILANDFFEETAAGVGPIQDLRQREFRLEDGEVIAIAGAAMGRAKGCGRRRSHLRNSASILSCARVTETHKRLTVHSAALTEGRAE